MQLELDHSRIAGPRDGLVEQCSTDPAASVPRGHHQTEVGDVATGLMRVAGDRERPTMAPVVGDEDRGVGMAFQRA